MSHGSPQNLSLVKFSFRLRRPRRRRIGWRHEHRSQYELGNTIWLAPTNAEEAEKMKNYFALHKIISVESGVVNAVDFDGYPLNIEFNPTITPKEAMQTRYPVDSIHMLRVAH